MLKINSYYLFLLTALFFNSTNIRVFSLNSSHAFNQYSRDSSKATNTNNNTTSSVGLDTQRQQVINIQQTCPVPVRSSVMPQSYHWHFNSFTNNTSIPSFMLSDWDGNDATNTSDNTHDNIPFLMNHDSNPSNAMDISTTTNNDNLSPLVPHTQLQQASNEVSDVTITTRSEQSSPSIYEHPENSVEVFPLFPSSNITPQPYNWPNSSTNTLAARSFEDLQYLRNAHFFMDGQEVLHNSDYNNSTDIFNNNDFSLSMALDSRNSNNASADISSTAHSKQGAEVDGDEDDVLTEKDKTKKKKTKKKKCTKTYTCPICSKVLASQGSLTKHKKTHDPNRPRPHRCNICHKSFVEKSTLKRHLRTHIDEKPFKCDFCNKAFPSQFGLDRHKRIHTGEKPFECNYCSKRFKTNYERVLHHRVHTGEKPYKCHICQKGLKSKGVLKDHLNKHLGKKPYKCNIGNCTKAYTSKGGLRSHKKMHKRPKPFTCHYCGAAFTHKNEYENHILYEESTDEDRKCHICKKVYVSKYHLVSHNKRSHPVDS